MAKRSAATAQKLKGGSNRNSSRKYSPWINPATVGLHRPTSLSVCLRLSLSVSGVVVTSFATATTSKRLAHGVRRLLLHHQFPSRPIHPAPVNPLQARLFHLASSNSSQTSPPRSQIGALSSLLFPAPKTPYLNSKTPFVLPGLSSGIRGLVRFAQSGNFLGRGHGARLFSAKSSNLGKFGGGLGKSAAWKPMSVITSTAARYRDVAGLQVEAFWRRNYMFLVGALGVVVCIALWRIMFGIASTFIGLSEGMAKYGFLALATAIVCFIGMYIHARFTLNPDKIYRISMRKLNTCAAMLEVMGAPLTGTDVRAYVMSGGRPKLKNFKLKLGGKRCFLIFPIRGSERRGLVSVEAKKKKGQYEIKLLAVDIPMATGPDQRLFLIGDEQEYKVGGGLISELRDPIVKALAAEKEFEDLDQKEEEDEIREREEAEKKQQEREREERALEEAERNKS